MSDASQEFSTQDAEAIRALTDAHCAAVLAHDPDAFLATCTDDIHFFPPDQVAVSGHEACRAYLEEFPTPATFTPSVQDVEGAGDLAFSRGQAAATFDDESGATFTWMAVHRRQPDGSRKMARDMWVLP
jgi:ketosteroid isomerase-like protein